MALYENGYKNNLVTFGLDLSPKLLTTLVTLNPKNIIIATNNDSSSKNNRGLQSAVKIFLKFFVIYIVSNIVLIYKTIYNCSNSHKLRYRYVSLWL